MEAPAFAVVEAVTNFPFTSSIDTRVYVKSLLTSVSSQYKYTSFTMFVPLLLLIATASTSATIGTIAATTIAIIATILILCSLATDYLYGDFRGELRAAPGESGQHH